MRRLEQLLTLRILSQLQSPPIQRHGTFIRIAQYRLAKAAKS